MTKAQAIQIIAEELVRRLPKNNKDGFLPSPEVYEALDILLPKK